MDHWHSDVFLFNEFGDSLVDLVSFLRLELDGRSFTKQDVALSLNFFSVELSVVLMVSDELLVLCYLSSDVVNFGL